MASILDAVVGGTTSNSYISLADADTFWSKKLETEEWLAFSKDERDKALIQATSQSEMLVHLGVKYYNTTVKEQSLHYPRANDIDEVDGSTIIIPQPIEDYTCIQALYLLEKWKSPDLLDRRQLQSEGISNISLDGISENYRFNGAKNMSVEAWELLRAYIVRQSHINIK